MKISTRTIIVFIALNLITAGFALSQSSGTAAVSQPPSATNVIQDQSELETLPSSIALSTGRRTAGTGNSVLIIPTQEMKTEEILTINEDINIMSRILEGKLNQVRHDRSNVNWMFSGNRWMSDPYGMVLGLGSNKVGCMYLQGYGVLFMMNVDFPLSAPPGAEKQEQKEPEKENVDEVWEKTKQQIYEPQETSRRGLITERTEVKYDAEKVEKLKTTLIESLKHAANIRILKPDESIILSITGSDVSDKIISVQALPGTNRTLIVQEKAGQKITRVYEGSLPDDIGTSSPTVLVIRAKKSDIGNFAKGDLNLDSFRQRVQILSYPLLGENVSGIINAPILPTTGELF